MTETLDTSASCDSYFVRPDARAFLDMIASLPGPKLHQTSPEEARRMGQRMTAACDRPAVELAVVRDLATPEGIRLRLFDARPERGPGPVIVFYHGGGWVMGDIDGYAGLCAEIARLTDLPLVSVDYRLAPEHPWPAAPDDAEAATRWIATKPAELGLDITGLVLAGDSAGGQLTIITALSLRDAPAALPVLAQWPIYPVVTMSGRQPSITTFGEGYLLSAKDLAWFLDHYAPDPRHWRANPDRRDPTGLPPTLLTTASLDPLRDQGADYAAQLAAAGVKVIHHMAEGTIHGFLTLRQAMPSGQEDLHDAIKHLRTLIG